MARVNVVLPTRGQKPYGPIIAEAVDEIQTAINSEADVAYSGDYQDLINRPAIPNTPGQVGADPAGTAQAILQLLAAVATSGNYSDLSGRPTIPTTPQAIGADPAGTAQALIHALSQVASSGSYSDLNNKPDLTLKADLVSGKVPASQLPSIAISNVVTVASKTAMTALTTSQVQVGDLAVVSADPGAGTYILSADDPSVLANWVLLKSPTDSVTSVNGHSGAVSLTSTDVGLGNVDNTSDANKPISSATQTALNSTVVGGSISGDNLVLTKRDNSTVTAGNVRGPQGIQGLRGIQGDTGPQGLQGVAGLKGDKGDPGNPGLTGSTGAAGPANTLSIGTVNTGAPGTNVYAQITGTSPNQSLSLVIPRGDTGIQGIQGIQGLKGDSGIQGDPGTPGSPGPANSLSIGTISTGLPGTSALASITGTAPNQTLNLTVPQGPQGAAGPQNLVVGPTNTLDPAQSGLWVKTDGAGNVLDLIVRMV